MLGVYVGVGVAVVVVLLLRMVIVMIPGQNAAVVERLGKFKCVLLPGLHVLVPFVDNLHTFKWLDGKSLRTIPTNVQKLDLDELTCFTHEGTSVVLDTTLYFKVDKLEQVYENVDPVDMLEAVARETLITTIAKETLQNVLYGGHGYRILSDVRHRINKSLQEKHIGLECTQFNLESSRAEDENLLKQTEAMAVAKTQQELEYAKRKQELENAMALKEAQKKLLQLEEEISLMQAQNYARRRQVMYGDESNAIYKMELLADALKNGTGTYVLPNELFKQFLLDKKVV